MDPITTAIVAALSKLSESVIKDTYVRLKDIITKKHGSESDLVDAVKKLEKKPESAGRKEMLKEEVAAAKADQDPEIVEVAQALLNELKKLGVQPSDSTVIQKAGNSAIQIAGPVSGSVIAVIAGGIGERQFNRVQSNDYNERGRERIRVYGKRMARNREWDWWPLGQAIEYYVDSIRYDPQNQHPWINLAYVYHLIGERQKALECLDKALELATPGPNYPGRHYKQVKAAVDSDSHLSGGRVVQPSMPQWFRDKYDQFL